MPGIIRFDRFSRRQGPVSRRSFMATTVSISSAAALGTFSASGQGTATPQATPGEIKGPDMGLYKGKAPQRLEGILELIPPDLAGGADPTAWLFCWLDMQAQLAALGGVSPMDLLDGSMPVGPITGALISTDPLFNYALAPETKETFGFSPLEINQIVTVGMPPDQVTIYAGGTPIENLPGIWEKAGYEHKTGENGEYWTVGESGEVDFDSPVGTIGMGLLNNVAIVNDDVLVFASRIELVEAIQVQARDGGASVADEKGVPDLMAATPPDAVNVIALPGAALDASTIVPENPGVAANASLMDLLAESDDAVGPMPVSELAFFGVTGGAATPAPEGGTPVVQGQSDAYMFVDLLTGSPEDAAQATKVVTWRVQNMTSPTSGHAYNELLTPDTSGPDLSSGSVAGLAFTSPYNLAIWTQMVYARDLWPFVYMEIR